tara:strand:- start:45 stop:3875 length:3831 start_codon:yes stop_codon:yes gene_type:complete
MSEQFTVDQDIDRLLADPTFKTEFDAKYGEGNAAGVLQQLAQPTTQAKTINAPVSSPTAVEPDKSEDTEIYDTWDTIKAVPRGALKAVDSMANFAARHMGDITFLNEKNEFDIKFHSAGDVEKLLDQKKWGRMSDLIDAPDTVVGGGVEGVSQFITGFVGPGKFFKVGNLLAAGAPKTAAVISGISRGAVADFAAFEGQEANLSDFLASQDLELFGLVDALKTNPDDTDLQNRLRNALEGAGLGLGLEGIIKVVRGMGYFKKGATDQASKLGKEGADEIQKETQEVSARAAAKEAEEAAEVPKPKDDAADKPDLAPISARQNEDGQLELIPETFLERQKRLDAAAKKESDYGKILDNEADSTTFPVRDDAIQTIFNATRVREGQSANVSRADAAAEFGVKMRQIDDENEILDLVISGQEILAKEFDAAKGGATKDWGVVSRQINGTLTSFSKLFKTDRAALLERFKELSPGDYRKLDSDLKAKVLFAQTLTKHIRSLAQIDIDISEGLKEAGEFSKYGYSSIEEMRLDLDHMAELLMNLRAITNGQSTAIGRAMNAQRMKNKGSVALETALLQAGRLSNNARLDYYKRFVKAVDEGEVPDDINKAWSAMDRLNSLRINFMLSGTNTQIINTLSNFMNMNLLGIEQTMGGIAMGNKEEIIRGLKQIGYMYTSMNEAMGMAIHAARADKSVLDQLGGKIEMDDQMLNIFGGDKLSLKSRNMIKRDGILRGLQGDQLNDFIETEFKRGRSIQGVGNLAATLPSRLLLFSDEFFKQMSYRGKLKTDLYIEGRFDKGITDTTALNKYIKDGELKGFNADGSAAIKGSDKQAIKNQQALEIARETTFTTELEGFFAGIQAMAVKFPAVRFVLPFIKTPTNLLFAAGRRVPLLSRKSKIYKQAMESGDASKIAQAKGKIITGWGVVGTGAFLAMQGRLTGSGPQNPKTKSEWQAKGWRPYSVVTYNDDGTITYTDYKRWEPLSTHLGIIADSFEIIKESELEGVKGQETKITDIVLALTMSVAENSINKTYVRGVHDMMSALTQTETKGLAVMASVLNSMTPSIINQLNGDPYFRETRGLLDGIKARFDTDLGTDIKANPKRNIVGEKVLRQQDKWQPFSSSVEDTNDIVLNEFASLGYHSNKHFGPPTNRRMGTLVDFSKIEHKNGQSVFDYFLEKTAQPFADRPTLRQMLEDRIKIARQLELGVGSRDNPDSPRSKQYEKIFSQYREAAKTVIVQEGLYDPNASEGVKKFAEEYMATSRRKKSEGMKSETDKFKELIQGRF